MRLLPLAMGFRPEPQSFFCLMNSATHFVKRFDIHLAVGVFRALGELALGGYFSFTKAADHILGKVAASIEELDGTELTAIFVASAQAKSKSMWMPVQHRTLPLVVDGVVFVLLCVCVGGGVYVGACCFFRLSSLWGVHSFFCTPFSAILHGCTVAP